MEGTAHPHSSGVSHPEFYGPKLLEAWCGGGGGGERRRGSDAVTLLRVTMTTHCYLAILHFGQFVKVSKEVSVKRASVASVS